MLTIHDTIEKARLNGHRIPGELYLVGKLVNFQCCRFPIELSKNSVPKRGLVPIPVGIGFSGTFLPYAAHLVEKQCPANPDFAVYSPALHCPIFDKEQFAGMLWVSERYYSHAAMWMYEARTEGIQLRIKQLHCGIEIGTSWVLLAHRKSIVDYSEGAGGWVNDDTGQAETAIKYKPGIFTLFQVEAIEYVIEKYVEKSTPAEVEHLQALCAAGVTLVNVIKDEELSESDLDSPPITQGYE